MQGKCAEKCDEPLVSGLPHVAFSSSSSMSGSYSPGYAKINKRGGAGGWSPSDSDHYQWLQVDFGNRKQISAIATQGRYSSSDWVTQYRMLYSDTGRNWKPYHQDGNIWIGFQSTVRKGVEEVYAEKEEENRKFERVALKIWQRGEQGGVRELGGGKGREKSSDQPTKQQTKQLRVNR
ncbi:hypothetical protein H8958_000876 [Nasalis larvatus]